MQPASEASSAGEAYDPISHQECGREQARQVAATLRKPTRSSTAKHPMSEFGPRGLALAGGPGGPRQARRAERICPTSTPSLSTERRGWPGRHPRQSTAGSPTGTFHQTTRPPRQEIYRANVGQLAGRRAALELSHRLPTDPVRTLPRDNPTRKLAFPPALTGRRRVNGDHAKHRRCAPQFTWSKDRRSTSLENAACRFHPRPADRQIDCRPPEIHHRPLFPDQVSQRKV